MIEGFAAEVLTQKGSADESMHQDLYRMERWTLSGVLIDETR